MKIYPISKLCGKRQLNGNSTGAGVSYFRIRANLVKVQGCSNLDNLFFYQKVTILFYFVATKVARHECLSSVQHMRAFHCPFQTMFFHAIKSFKFSFFILLHRVMLWTVSLIRTVRNSIKSTRKTIPACLFSLEYLSSMLIAKDLPIYTIKTISTISTKKSSLFSPCNLSKR